jgi:predicted deacylase
LTVISPQVADMVEKGDFVASVVDIFGFMCDEYFAPETGVIVGKSTNPANYQGVYPLCHELNIIPVRMANRSLAEHCLHHRSSHVFL